MRDYGTGTKKRDDGRHFGVVYGPRWGRPGLRLVIETTAAAFLRKHDAERAAERAGLAYGESDEQWT